MIIVEDEQQPFIKNTVQIFKFYGIPNVGVINLGYFNPFEPIQWLDMCKYFLPYLEADITDICNLKCAACYHFANFSLKEDFYPLETFRRDIQQVTRNCDILTFRLLGGEPFTLKNFDEYVIVLRKYLPQAALRIVSNGTLIPSLPQRTLDTLRNNRFAIDISTYPPTLKLADKIKTVLEANGIPYNFGQPVEMFNVFLTMHGGNNPLKARSICGNEPCRSVYNGKIYKCPLDAFYFKMIKKFGLKNYPKATGVDLYAPNFSSLLPMLDGNVELCHWCGEQIRKIPWEPSNKPRLEDWLGDPEEIKKLQ